MKTKHPEFYHASRKYLIVGLLFAGLAAIFGCTFLYFRDLDPPNFLVTDTFFIVTMINVTFSFYCVVRTNRLLREYRRRVMGF